MFYLGKLISNNKNQKEVKTRYEEYLDLFRKDKRDIDYEKVKKLYDEIKKYYETKIKNNEISISVEKIRLETNLGKYNGNIYKLGINYFNTIVIVFLTLFFEKMNLFGFELEIFRDTNLNKSLNDIIKICTLFLMVLALIKIVNDKNTLLQNKSDVLDNIKLKVLEDLEKEYDTQKTKKQEIENQQVIVEKLKGESVSHRKDTLIADGASVILKIAENLVHKDSWIKKIFKKKK